MRIFALVADAFGGSGGIAKFNRDLLTALCTAPGVERVVALPRLSSVAPELLPDKLEFNTSGVGGRLRYVAAVLQAAIRNRQSAVVLCGHINLLPLAFLVRKLLRPLASGHPPPLLLVIHGIEAWRPTRSTLVNRLVRRVDAIVAVSEFTRKKFWDWAQPNRAQSFILPNCVNLARFTPGPKNSALLDRYQLRDKTVLLTVARLSALERYKGIDEVIEVVPALAREIPNLRYLIVGDGTDRERLQQKVDLLGLRDRVIFAGHVPEAEKVDHYRLADAFVMPGWGEGFGIVYLEAMACGVPVVASKLDASQEAVRGGSIGGLVNPRDLGEVVSGTLAALRLPNGVPAGLDHFSQPRFQQRVHAIVHELPAR